MTDPTEHRSWVLSLYVPEAKRQQSKSVESVDEGAWNDFEKHSASEIGRKESKRQTDVAGTHTSNNVLSNIF